MIKKVYASRRDEAIERGKLETLYANCFKLAEESKKNKPKKLILTGDSAKVLLDQLGNTLYKFVGGPGHGKYTTVKNDTAWMEFERSDGTTYRAFYFFLESEGNYHWKFWL